MKTSDFYYDLPKELIAQDPLEDRSSSRLLHLSMKDGSMEHRHFTFIRLRFLFLIARDECYYITGFQKNQPLFLIFFKKI